MIVVLASRYDEIARNFVSRWHSQGAAHLTCEDLSVHGWRYQPGTSHPSTAVVGGREVDQGEISGVLTRLPWVLEQELLHIIPADRPYVAAEMSAFLLAWLSELPCPVLNRPTPSCLAGPNWRVEQWIVTAARMGMAVHPIQRTLAQEMGAVPEAPAETPVTVTVVGEQCIGSGDQSLATQARQLADMAGADLLAVQFSGPGRGALFLGAHVWPDISSEDVANAVFEYMQQRQRRRLLLEAR